MSEDSGRRLPETSFSLLEEFNRHAVSPSTGTALAVVSTHQPAGLYGIPNQDLDDNEYRRKPYLRWTFAALRTAVLKLATGLHAHGITEGMPFFTFIQNGAEYPMAYFAATALGCTFIPLNTRNLLNKDEVTHMMNTALLACTIKSPVIIASNGEVARQIDSLNISGSTVKFILSQIDSSGDWLDFSQLLETPDCSQPGELLSRASKDASIFFTSGTTSLPKGCLWEYPQPTMVLVGRRHFHERDVCFGDKLCTVVPNNHALGYLSIIITLCNGATIVYPGPMFEPGVMYSILHTEKITHTILVPTMVHALVGQKAIHGQRLRDLKSVILGGTVVTPEVLRLVSEELGASMVENAFGMSEGALVGSGPHHDWRADISGDDVAVGKAAPGSSVKICAEGENTPLPRGILGELHVSSLTVIQGYIGKPSNDFYRDKGGGKWFKTGDQAVMNSEGRIFIVGRYKDMIIRGGENIAPAAMEGVLQANPKLSHLNIQVVAAPDAIAGDVPVVVSDKMVDGKTKEIIHNTLLNNMGTIYAPDEVLTLKELGLTDYPRTMSGKIQKTKIAKLVKDLRSRRDTLELNGDVSCLGKDVKSIWARAVGISEDRLSVDAPLADFADSITVMRVRDRIKRKTGKIIPITAMVAAGTIREQIKLIESQSYGEEKPRLKQTPKRNGPPSMDDMAHLVEDPDLYEPTKELVCKVIHSYSLSWDDVQDVLPAYDFAVVMAEKRIIDSWNLKMAYLTKTKDKAYLRTALEATFENHPIVASFIVWDEDKLGTDLALHVTLRRNQKFLNQIIEDAGSLKTLDDLKSLALKYPQPDHATFPGPLIRITIYHIEETGDIGLLLNINHTIMDASYSQIFFADLDQALSDPSAILPQHIDYQLWTNSYYNLRTSPEARRATKWHVNRLKDIAQHKRGLYPSATKRPPYDPEKQDGSDNIQHSFEAPGLPELRRSLKNITNPIFLKSAWALLNSYKTGYDHVLFSNLEAARMTFPFIPKVMEETGQYEATDVAGPSIQSVINLVEIISEEAVADFLARMQDDQNNLTKYASAPWREIISQLGHAGPMITDVTQSSIFNWVFSGMGGEDGNPFKNLEMVNFVARPQVGVAINAGIGGEDANNLFIQLRGDAFSTEEFRQMALDLEKITCWITDPANLQKNVGNYVESLVE